MENFSNYLEWVSGLVLFAYAFLAHYRINKLEKIIKEIILTIKHKDNLKQLTNKCKTK